VKSLEDEKVNDRNKRLFALCHFVYYFEECDKICLLRYDRGSMLTRKDDIDESISP